MTSFTWLGDSDPEATDIRMYGHSFVKGESVNITDKDVAAKLEGNPMFSKEAKAQANPADEPDADEIMSRSEQGTVKGALKARLRELGVDVRGNPSEDTLRSKLADATKD